MIGNWIRSSYILSWKRKAKDKNRRDKGAALGPLHIGNKVLVRKRTERGGTWKLRSYWQNNIYKIVTCKGEYSLVYEVQPEKVKMERREEY